MLLDQGGWGFSKPFLISPISFREVFLYPGMDRECGLQRGRLLAIWALQSMYVKREGLIQIQTQSCGKGSFSTGKKRGEDSFRALFITAVIGSDEADQPGLTATVNMLRKAGLKLQYELFRQNMRKDFLAARKIRHCSKASRYGFDPRWLIRANSTPWLLIPISMMFITRYHSIRPGRMGFQNISQPRTQEGLHSSTRSARGVDVTPFTAHPLVLELRL